MPLNAGVLLSDVHVMLLHVGLAISNVTVRPAVANELTSNITLSTDDGAQPEPVPPELVAQCVPSLQLPVPPIQ